MKTLDNPVVNALSLKAHKVYIYLLCLKESGKKVRPSYQTIGAACFYADTQSTRTQRNWATAATKELIEKKLIEKKERVTEEDERLSNTYFINQGRCF